MKTSTFWIFLAIVAIITVGAAVGGAVGGTIAAREDFLGKPASNQPVVNRYLTINLTNGKAC
jgi:hypothetical protein